MMQQRRNRVVWWIAIGVAFFFLVDPFRLFQSKNMPETRANSEVQAQMRAFIAVPW